MIRRYSPDEFEKILAINNACFTGIERAPEWALDALLKECDVWVADTGSQVVGYVAVRPDDTPYIWQIAVLPEYQNRHYGKALMDTVRNYYADDFDALALNVHVDNAKAQHFYLNEGFRVVGIEKSRYGIGQNGLLMKRCL